MIEPPVLWDDWVIVVDVIVSSGLHCLAFLVNHLLTRIRSLSQKVFRERISTSSSLATSYTN